MESEAGKTFEIFVCETFVVETEKPAKVAPEASCVIPSPVQVFVPSEYFGQPMLFARPPTISGFGSLFTVARV